MVLALTWTVSIQRWIVLVAQEETIMLLPFPSLSRCHQLANRTKHLKQLSPCTRPQTEHASNPSYKEANQISPSLPARGLLSLRNGKNSNRATELAKTRQGTLQFLEIAELKSVSMTLGRNDVVRDTQQHTHTHKTTATKGSPWLLLNTDPNVHWGMDYSKPTGWAISEAPTGWEHSPSLFSHHSSDNQSLQWRRHPTPQKGVCLVVE